MTEEEQLAFERRFRELIQDLYQANPLSKECRPGLEIRPEGDRLVLVGHRKDTGEAVDLASFPRSWVAGK
jgi:hypothetical protein